MRAGFHELALADDQDAVGPPDGGQPMGDHERGAVLHQAVQGQLHEAFALGIERTGGFIQNENGRVFQDGPGNGHPLALAAGELHAALAHQGLIALREGGVMNSCAWACRAASMISASLAPGRP